MKKKIFVAVVAVVLISILFCVGWKKELQSFYLPVETRQIETASLTIIVDSTNSDIPPIICDISMPDSNRRDTLLAKNGVYKKVFNLLSPIYLTLYVPGNYARIYLAPGYKSIIRLQSGTNYSFTFEGDGYLGNSYLRDVFSVSKINVPHIKINDELTTPEDFVKKANDIARKRDSVFQAYMNMYSSLISKDSIISKLLKVENEENRYFLPRILMNYALSREIPFEYRQLFFEKYIKNLNQVHESVDFTSSENKRYFFLNVLRYYVDVSRVSSDSTRIFKIGIYAYTLEIAKKKFAGKSQSYLINYNLNILTDYSNMYNTEYPTITSLLNLYKSNLGDKKYNELLKKVKKQNPENTNTDKVNYYEIVSERGVAMSLNTKLSNVTVIDVWATWCGPCIQSFPLMLNLRKRYESNKSVKFIWISIDENKAKWEAKVKKTNLPTNDSFWIKEGIHSRFVSDLAIGALPRYIIMDKNGKVLEAFAPGVNPDERNLRTLIEHYILKKD